jgi:intergrase/recombinase
MGRAADGVVDDHYLQLLGDFTLSENAKKVVNSLTKFLKFKEVV